MKKKKQKNHIFKALNGVKKYAVLTPIMMIGEVVMECLIPLIMAFLVDFLNISKSYGEGFNSVESLTSQLPNVDIVRIKTFIQLMEWNFTPLLAIALCGSLIIVASFLSLFFGVGGAKYGAKAGGLFARNLRKQIYDHIQTLSFENLDKYQTSSLVTRLTTDVTSCQDAFITMIRMLFRSPVMFIVSFIMCSTIKIELTAILLVSFPILVIALLIIMTKAHPYFEKMFKTYDKLNQRVQENLIGIRVVKSFVREDFEIEKFKKTNATMRQTGISAEKILSLNGPIMNLVMYGTIFAVCFIGGKFFVVGDASMALGDLQACITYVMQILSSLMMVSMVFVMLVMSRASFKRVNEILNEESTLTNPENPIYDIKDGSVEFDQVNFSYSNDVNNLHLEGADFKVESGQVIGVIGGTGSSKTTLVSLISRLYDVTTGSVKVGGVDVREYDLETLRNQVAVVLQKNVLFSGSIRENMKWGKEDASDEEIIEALKNAQAYEFVSKLPGGLDYDLGQGGVNVSGGQKQRLCIARALLKSPKVLILDASTSAVDTKTDALIRESFRTKIPNVTKFIIAQRINSVQDADKILVLDEGKIHGFGTHEELLENNHIYKDVFESQTKGDE